MEKFDFNKLALKINSKKSENAIIKVDDSTSFEVRNYLPIDEKGQLISFVINGAIDANTGCFSPLRIEVFFTVGLVKWYTNIEFSQEELLNIGDTYDKLEQSGLSDIIIDAIPEAEFNFIKRLVESTTVDIARFNNSFVGMMSAMNGDATSLNDQLEDILSKIKNKEGMELLSVIKEEMGGRS